MTIGAHAQSITPALAAGLKLTQDSGVILSDIDRVARLQRLVACKGCCDHDGGFAVDSLPKYTAFLYVHKRGSPIRDGCVARRQAVTVSVTPVNAPPQVDNLSDLIKPEKDLIAPLGIFVMDLKHSEVGAMLNLRSDTGVLVIGLLGGEPAIAADLSVWGCDSRCERHAPGGLAAVAADSRGVEPGDAVVLEVERQSVLQYVAFEME